MEVGEFAFPIDPVENSFWAGLAREAGRPWIADESFARMRN